MNDDVKRLRAIGGSLCDSLRFAAPEIWMLHIGEALAGAYHLGKNAAVASDEQPDIVQPSEDR